EIIHKWAPLDLAIIEYPDPEQPSLDQKAYCERQGRCFLGCLPGARHTLNKTIIKRFLYPKNAKPAIELRSFAEVRGFEKIPGGWEVKYDALRLGVRDEGRQKEVTADVLVVSAGCLPTTELMLRAQNNGLTLSRMAGERFSTNGDFAGFIDHA